MVARERHQKRLRQTLLSESFTLLLLHTPGSTVSTGNSIVKRGTPHSSAALLSWSFALLLLHTPCSIVSTGQRHGRVHETHHTPGTTFAMLPPIWLALCEITRECISPRGLPTTEAPAVYDTTTSHHAHPTPCRRQNYSGDSHDQNRSTTRASPCPLSQHLPRDHARFFLRRCRFRVLVALAVENAPEIMVLLMILRVARGVPPRLPSRGGRWQRGGS